MRHSNFAFLVCAVTCLAANAPGQTVEGSTSVTVLREQAGSIAREVLDSLPSPDTAPYALKVEGAPLGGVIENAFTDAFAQKGKDVLPGEDVSMGAHSMIVVVLEQSVGYSGQAEGMFDRTVTSRFEIRVVSANQSGATFLRTFERQNTDRVPARESIPGVTVDAGNGEGDSLFERVLAPVVVVAGTIVIVYLFFTVRS